MAAGEFDLQRVSIHAPARGATCKWGFSIESTFSFNPRARAGRDKRQMFCRANKHSFNPRARAGRDEDIANIAGDIFVSIHAPARGATLMQ